MTHDNQVTLQLVGKGVGHVTPGVKQILAAKFCLDQLGQLGSHEHLITSNWDSLIIPGVCLVC